jgi:hypothetical protein
MKQSAATATLQLRPWFEHTTRRSRGARVIFGHWSAPS